MNSLQGWLAGACVVALTACSPPPDQTAAATAKTQPPHGQIIGEGQANAAIVAVPADAAVQAQTQAEAPATQPIAASTSEVGQKVNAATWAATGLNAAARRDALIRVQVLLDRAHFSPGVIDGQNGSNLKKAIASYETANGLTSDGLMDDAVWAKLSSTDAQPVLTDYAITADDVKGPFLTEIPSDFKAMSKLTALGYTSPRELLAEKFHMDEALLTALNPGVDFTQAGASIVVVAPTAGALPADIARIEVDKAARQVRVYGAGEKLLAAYPATVGSSDRPAPEGEWAVRAVALDPNYNYDPSRLTFGDMKGGKMTIPPGPNNPVGSVWIALTKDTYGIHGAPDPRLVGKTASHGCVRLTNWDARELAAAAKKGTPVVFVGTETTTRA